MDKGPPGRAELDGSHHQSFLSVSMTLGEFLDCLSSLDFLDFVFLLHLIPMLFYYTCHDNFDGNLFFFLSM